MVQVIAELLEASQQQTRHCELHGAYQSRWVPQIQAWSGCPHCLLENIAKQDAQQRQRIMRDVDASARRPHRLEGACVQALRSDDPVRDAVYARMRAWVQALPRVVARGAWMLLAGGCGCGKSFALRALAAAVQEAGFSAVFLTQHRALQAWRDDPALLQQMRAADVVLLDECSAAQSRHGAMFDWLNERYEQRRACVFAGNTTVSRISSKAEIAASVLGEPLSDRLLSCGDVLPMPWATMRAPDEALPF